MIASLLLEQGRRALLAGDSVLASRVLEEVLLSHEDDENAAECWFLLGAARHRMQQLSKARQAFLKAAELDFRHLQSRLALAAVCLGLGDVETAVKSCLEATSIAPNDPDAWFSLGVAREAAGVNEAACDAYDRALVLCHDHVGALKNQRALLMTLGRFDEAVEKSRAIARMAPFSVDAQFGVGEALRAARRYGEAVQCLGMAARLASRDARVALHYGFALAQIERFDEAQKQLDHAASIDSTLVRDYRKTIFGVEAGDAAAAPPRLEARALFLLRHFDRIERCDWAEREYFIERFASLVSEGGDKALTERALGFRSMAMGLDPAIQLELARQIARGIEAMHSDGAVKYSHARCGRVGRKRIRIAYISADFRNHPTALLLGDMFSWHDRSCFEVLGYALGSDDGSEQRRRMIAHCDRFANLDDLDDDAAAKVIASDEVDVLVDLTGYMDQARPGILARRPAPVQMAWLAYMATMGASWIDYVLADSVSFPSELEKAFSEAPIRLPDGIYCCGYAERQMRAPPARSALDLPENGIVLGAMHNHYKIDPRVFAVWMRLLASKSDAVLWMLDGSVEGKAALRSEALRYGINPDRLVFAPKIAHDEHLVRLQSVDLALDAPQCNGATTTADALARGVPVITCAGSNLMQRVAASLMNAAGQSELIAESLSEYERLAGVLLSDVDRLASLRQRFAEARKDAPFYAPKKWLRGFETGVQMAWERHCSGLPPQAIEVKGG